MTISILCGGSGTRLFPLSRELLPKQFVSLLPSEDSQTPSHSLFSQTLVRNEFLCKSHDGSFQIITNDNHYSIAQDQNTGPALTFAALKVFEDFTLSKKQDDIILALPSDHLIKDAPAYQKAIQEAIDLAQKGFLVTFGIKPTCPHTGYGYIKAKDNVVEKFIEKPSLEDATNYVKNGNYLWNSGMFCFKAEVFLKEIKEHSPQIYEGCKLTLEASKDKESEHFIRLDTKMSENLPDISIDYALMEKSQKVACVAGDFVWNDIGSFESLSSEYQTDEAHNASKNTFIQKDCVNNFVMSNKLVAGIGMEG